MPKAPAQDPYKDFGSINFLSTNSSKINNCAEKNKPVSKSGYEIWLETDYREGWNLNEDDVRKEDELMYDYDPPSYK